jgi:beta-N-acetylhexosaminidase
MLTVLALLAVLVVVVESPGTHISLRSPGVAKDALPTHGGAGMPAATDAGEAGVPAELDDDKALGQMLVGRFSGSEPPQRFLTRVRAGEVGGAILFEENLGGGESAAAALVERLQRAAGAGGNPPLLIMLDQEGGSVKRLPGPPTVAAAEMSSPGQAAEQGAATGRYLHDLGIDVDLAPVVDVGHPGGFLGSRSFGTTPAMVASRACAFAAGLTAHGVAATLKHFPGLGFATANTDEGAVTVSASAEQLRADYVPYRSCGSAPLTLVMVSNAIYPDLTGESPAVMSPLTYSRELAAAGVDGVVTISDDLETPAIAAQTTPARRAIDAGLDLLLYATAESTSATAYSRLLSDLRGGRIDAGRVQAAAAKILALKASLAAAG